MITSKQVTIKVPTGIESLAERTRTVLQTIVDTTGPDRLASLVELIERDENTFRDLFRIFLRRM